MPFPLIILAGGRASRFGGDKPLAPVGPNGEALLDYTIHDARAAGFDPVVLVVRSEREDTVREHLRRTTAGAMPALIAQDLDTTVAPRAKPWGTVHAIVAAAPLIGTAFAVANGDDLYGAESFRRLAERLETRPDVHHLIAFPWEATLSPNGSANRGVCDVDADGRLLAIVERRGLRLDHGLPAGTMVSMNLWGFRSDAMNEFRKRLIDFADEHRDDPAAELVIPELVGTLLATQGWVVEVTPTTEQWVGVTYQDDVEWAQARVAALIAEGRYPHSLSVAPIHDRPPVLPA
jgi:NDP-sugar pyrophosphorylase family protein